MKISSGHSIWYIIVLCTFKSPSPVRSLCLFETNLAHQPQTPLKLSQLCRTVSFNYSKASQNTDHR